MLHVAMDDDCKEYGKNKPPQKLYQPGSGPLRRTSYGFDAKMEIGVNNDLQGRENHRPNNKNNTTSRLKKPERELYVARSGDNCFDSYSGDSSNYRANKPDKHHLSSHSTNNYSKKEFYRDGSNKEINFNRQNRQASESRSMTMQMKDNNDDRNRDSRSMETSSKRYTNFGGKPPSGRRNSSGYIVDSGRFKHPMNLDNIPPRFRKKFLESSSGHHSFDGSEHLNKEKSYSSENTQTNHSHNQYIAPNPSWSQTLPSRGRGRQKEEYVGFDREKFINTYLKNLNATNKSTLSNSYVNLYESIPINNQVNDNVDVIRNSVSQDSCNMDDNVTKNGAMSDSISENKENSKSDGTNQQGRDNFSHSSTVDMVLDWTEEVEKNIKLEEALDTSTSFMQNIKSSTSQEVNFAEPREPKRSGRSRRRDRRSSSRGQRNAEKKNEKLRKDSNVSVTLENDDNNFGLHHEAMSLTFKQKDRERRDSHRSNRSSTIGNSREDLDRWRSLRSYSREHSTEGRIMSQCNSRETSMNRSTVSRDFDGFRVPAVPKIKGSVCGDVATGGERGRQSPAHSNVPVVAAPTEAGGGGRRGRKRASRRRGRHTEPALPVPAPHPPGAIPAPTSTNWRDEIIEAKKHTNDKKSDSGHNRNRLHSGMSDKSESSNAHPGILVLPQNSVTNLQRDQGHRMETQKTLFDPQNPSKPIVVQTSTSQDSRMEQGPRDGWSGSGGGAGYECEAEAGDRARGARHRALLQEVDRADAILQAHSLRGPIALAHHWGDVIETRKLLQNALQRLLMSDLKYCQANNVEHQFWKILYYNFIEVLRKSFTQVSAEDKPKIVKLINVIIAEGNTYFENLVQMLEKTYKFNTDDYINDNHPLPPKGLGYVGLALISVQKMYVFLGDLARYKEQVNETNNYSKSKFWYTKAQQINPKNGRPYNQLAILAIYARRKLDAVYYYMRSLMSSNPFHSARESLLSLFDENRKKYEAAERKRRVALESMKSESSAEGESGGAVRRGGGLRREVWVRPSGSKTTTLRPHAEEQRFDDMSSVELNKIFITSYLHVHGKLITKIGMETFHESAVAMLRQFRALLSRQPLQTPAARLLQLTALNMFAVETCANKKDSSSDGSGGRGAWLECALGVSLLMFGAMLERCCALLPEPHNSQPHTDALLLLPAIKVWSDWMLCHSSIWNPPPSFENYEMEDNDPWDWLAKLMNILEDLDDKSIELENEMKEGYVQIRLAEDASLAGFTPLMYMEPAAGWVRPDPALPPHHAEHLLRTRNLLFFGTEYLVGVDPPVLTLEYPAGGPPRYVSAVKHNTSAHHQLHNLVLSEDSEDEEESCSAPISGVSTPTREPQAEGPEGADEATRNLLRRKEQLETHKATLEQRRQRMQEILRGGWISVELEVRPRWLVPDTNCFIDHLPLLQAIEAVPSQPYLLAVPLVVMTELEGLTRCERVGGAAGAALRWVGGAAGVRLATARGSLLASRAFTAEHTAPRTTNDDRVLATALNLHQNLASEPDTCGGGSGGEGGRVRRVREVVLLTDDRNLRVKALAADLPARDLPSFVRWAGIQSTEDLTGIDFKTRRSK